LDICDDIIFENENKIRIGIYWYDSQIKKVEDKIGRLKYFPDYEFGA
jgi:hypothetical protein